MASRQAATLATRLEAAHARLIAVLERVADDRWRAIPAPDAWSISKDAEHVAEATTYHQWIVRLTIGEKVSSRRPTIERAQLTSDLSRHEVLSLLSDRTDGGIRLLSALTDEQLDLATKPPRARGQRLATTIDTVLIGHYDVHRAEIEAKLRA